MKKIKNNEFKSTYTIVKEAIEAGNVRRVFNMIDGTYVSGLLSAKSTFEYFEVAEVLFDLISKNCTGFVVDICNRVSESIKNGCGITLSEKQRWCLAFAAVKIQPSCVDALEAYDAQLSAEDDNAASAKAEEVETVISAATEGNSANASDAAATEEETSCAAMAESAESAESKSLCSQGKILIEDVIEEVRHGRVINILKLRDARRFASNSRGEMSINTDVSARKKGYMSKRREDDEIVLSTSGRRETNINKLREELNLIANKGDVYIWLSGYRAPLCR